MQSPLLATKLRIPPRPPHLLPRSRLLDTLQEGLPHYRLILLVAPAGSGKTTLLADWVHQSDAPTAWLSLDEHDDDLERFLRYLVTAWSSIQPAIRERPAGLLLGAQMPDLDQALASLVNAAVEVAEHSVVVLDDYHLIQDDAIHQALAFLLDHLPPTVHVVLAGRSEPPLPVARYRARRQLLELHSQDLYFRADETAGFLRHTMGLDLSEEQVHQLQERLEGWIAGLQLAALTLQRQEQQLAHRPSALAAGQDSMDTAISGRHRHIADYLSQEVLAQLSGDLRRFLLQTSILESLCSDLCDAVTYAPNSQARLEQLARENLFLARLDDERIWYRYHRLFADFLQAELQRTEPAQVETLQSRAARWYLDHDLPEPAFRHALAAQDLPLVIELFDRYTNAKLIAGELAVLQRWLDALPAAWRSAYPAFELARAGLFAYSGQVDACMRCVEEIETQLAAAQSERARDQLARVTAVRCFIACQMHDLPQAEELAAQALATLPPTDSGFRPVIYGALGDVYRSHGRWTEAQANYQKGLEHTHAPAIRVQAAHLFGALADLELRQGHLQRADRYWRQALTHLQGPESWGRIHLPVAGWIYIRMGELHYEWNDLDRAWVDLACGLERAELGGDVRARIAGYVGAARLKLSQGHVDAAGDYLAQARPLVEQAAFSAWTARFERCRLELWLAQAQLDHAQAWAAQQTADDPDPVSGAGRQPGRGLALARLQIVQGDAAALQQAHTHLEALHQQAQQEGRTGIVIEALALRSLAHWQQQNRTAALACLEPALRLAEPEGYMRLFLDLGLPMARVLQEARTREVQPPYVERLLDAFADEPSWSLARHFSQPDALPEPLTPREQEVLELMAAGLTNREIGEALVISPETVKKHAGNIYSKLATTNRTEAVAKARALDLLS